ncbi:DUF6968 family protein [Arthrobacter tumbae]|uniref:DUF6968 family protein n=1 Tax=Arthrobacter tumbae TaxID=163874 RepID=UPI00195CDFBC|nr:hypothetical protein [Arthrobacter tumbae]MBM7781900.1 hypothetical protein [Arthrobacter tumbae]
MATSRPTFHAVLAKVGAELVTVAADFTVIASRTLTSADRDVVVDLGAPVRMDSVPYDWFCPYRITGLRGGAVEQSAYGIDAVQALILALTHIGERLSQAPDRIAFQDRAALGFPVIGTGPTENTWVIQLPLSVAPE